MKIIYNPISKLVEYLDAKSGYQWYYMGDSLCYVSPRKNTPRNNIFAYISNKDDEMTLDVYASHTSFFFEIVKKHLEDYEVLSSVKISVKINC